MQKNLFFRVAKLNVNEIVSFQINYEKTIIEIQKNNKMDSYELAFEQAGVSRPEV